MYSGQVGRGHWLLGAAFSSDFVVPILDTVIIGIVTIIDTYPIGSTLQLGRWVGMWEILPNYGSYFDAQQALTGGYHDKATMLGISHIRWAAGNAQNGPPMMRLED